MTEPERLPRDLSLRRIAVSTLWAVSILLAAVAVNVVGIAVIGGTYEWDRWLSDHRVHLLVWRFFLYVTLVLGWCWMRTRVVSRETPGSPSVRLRRAEVSAVLVIVLVETSTLIRLA